MTERKLEFWIYNHEEREFQYYDADRSKFVEIMQQDLNKISDALTADGIDGILIMDEGSERWYLAFSDNLGIVGQRTARRMADSIVRSGVTLPDGYWLKNNFELVELSDPNIGDLWKTVQQKYVISDLKGLQVDEETGLPQQLKERKERLAALGHKDSLTEAELSLQEAKEREKAKKKVSTKKTKAAMNKTKTKEAVKTIPKVKTRSSKGSNKDNEQKVLTASEQYKKFTVNSLVEFVKNGNTEIIAKGKLGTKETTISFSQDYIPAKKWSEKVVFLEEGTSINITIKNINDQLFVTNIK